MNRKLEIVPVGLKPDGVVCKIGEQTYRNSDFNFGKNFFTASNGVRIFSMANPQFNILDDGVVVQLCTKGGLGCEDDRTFNLKEKSSAFRQG